MDKKNILIVDDDETIRQTLKEIFESEHYSVDTAKIGKEAIEKSKTKFYNMALLDIKLPDMEGTKLLETIHDTMPKMIKIMVTGYPSLKNAVSALNMGADGYLMKPINPKRMLKFVKEKLKEQEETEKLSQDKVKNWIETRVQKLKEENR